MSVLLPCFNAAEFLRTSLDSLFAQTRGDFEIIAVDDGSRDATLSLLEQAARVDARLRIQKTAHQGIVAALEAARRLARAPLLARMDADDRCHRERLERQIAFLDAHPEVDVVASAIKLFPREALKDGLLRYEAWVNEVLTPDEITRDLFVESPLPHPSVTMRAETVERVGGYSDEGRPEDYDLWMRMAVEGCRFAKLADVLLDWRDRDGRLSRTDSRYSRDSFLALKAHYLPQLYPRVNEGVVLWGAGPAGKIWARRLIENDIHLHQFIDIDPRKIGKRIHGAQVVSPDDAMTKPGDGFLLVAVGALSRQRDRSSARPERRWRSARDEIREHLTRKGFVERRDFLCIA